MPTIYAWEGPSGSGKDYALAVIRDEYGDDGQTIILDRPHLPRCLDNWAGAWSSSFLEYEAIAAATMSRKDVVCNRFLLSRWVYRAIQFNSNRLTHGWYDEIYRSFNRFKTLAISEAWDRMGLDAYHKPTVFITVLMPTLDQLTWQRKQSGKEYPFDASIELSLYLQIASELARNPITGITVGISRS